MVIRQNSFYHFNLLKFIENWDFCSIIFEQLRWMCVLLFLHEMFYKFLLSHLVTLLISSISLPMVWLHIGYQTGRIFLVIFWKYSFIIISFHYDEKHALILFPTNAIFLSTCLLLRFFSLILGIMIIMCFVQFPLHVMCLGFTVLLRYVS